jgi:hypothetical protein
MWSNSRAGLGVTDEREALAGLGVPWPHENARSPCGEKRATTRMRREPNLPRAAGREVLQTHLPVNSAAARRVVLL